MSDADFDAPFLAYMSLLDTAAKDGERIIRKQGKGKPLPGLGSDTEALLDADDVAAIGAMGLGHVAWLRVVGDTLAEASVRRDAASLAARTDPVVFMGGLCESVARSIGITLPVLSPEGLSGLMRARLESLEGLREERQRLSLELAEMKRSLEARSNSIRQARERKRKHIQKLPQANGHDGTHDVAENTAPPADAEVLAALVGLGGGVEGVGWDPLGQCVVATVAAALITLRVVGGAVFLATPKDDGLLYRLLMTHYDMASGQASSPDNVVVMGVGPQGASFGWLQGLLLSRAEAKSAIEKLQRAVAKSVSV